VIHLHKGADMKRCFKCEKEKELADFYPHKQMKDGHLNKCKECTKKDEKERRIRDSERVRKMERERKSKRPVDPEVNRRRRNANPAKYKAQTAVGNALRDGKIIRPESCEVCGVAGEVHGHHADYSVPLGVVWVCVKCHSALHHD
jgi:hypothetical protein